MNKNHEVERVENLMYKGCEPHWHCTHCNNYWPFHCYGRKDLEQMECPARKALKEQEPRVLTHEEADAIAHQTEETAIYLERKSDKSLYAAIAGDTQGRVPNISWLGKERNYQDEYGISWRCWSAKPTHEQREATPWNT